MIGIIKSERAALLCILLLCASVDWIADSAVSISMAFGV